MDACFKLILLVSLVAVTAACGRVPEGSESAQAQASVSDAEVPAWDEGVWDQTQWE